ncbi:MAG: WYL domain-containing protein [Ktedonobacteraceae bacterium]|nr:WYL domain-containing protein [Ktedonobacteraceae bacterium]
MRADRLLSLLILLQAHEGMTTGELAQRLEVSRRTILRDVDALSFAGIPVTAKGGQGGGIFLDKNYRVSLTGLTVSEMQALFVPGPSGPLKDIGLEKAAENMLLKVIAALPVRHREQIEGFRKRIHFDPVWWQQEEKVTPFLSLLHCAVFEERCLHIRYERHNGEVSEREIEPYGLVAKGSTWYLVGKREGAFRTYRVSRLQHVVLLDEVFQRDHTFDLPSYWSEHSIAFKKQLSQFSFALQMDPKHLYLLNWYAEGQFRLSEDVDQTKNEWPIVSLTVSSLQAACTFVLRAGRHVKIVAPPELRAEVVKVAREIIVLHTQE